MGKQSTHLPILGEIAAGRRTAGAERSHGGDASLLPYAAGMGKLRNSYTIQRCSVSPAAIVGIRSR